MCKRHLAIGLAFLGFISTAQTQPVASPAPLPEELKLWLYPTSMNGRRGHRLDISRMVHSGSQVTASVTMHGLGLDRCRLQSQPAEGTFDGSKLLLKIKVAPGDNLTCPSSYELQRGPDGQFEGSYENAGKTGLVRRQ